LGHARAEVVQAISEAAGRGTSFGAPTMNEIELAKALCAAVPSVQMCRLVNSGSEATMSALRLARGYTGRDLIVKCEGAYHGGVDSLLVKAGSGLATTGQPDSAGVPSAFANTTQLIPYNDINATRSLFEQHGTSIAALIVEPVAGNMGVVLPDLRWLQEVRNLCTQHGALLIFDEVMTGFRVAYAGAQGLYGVTPDISCFGKIIGGGLPVGAYGASRQIMEQVAPLGPVYQAGTLSGNPLATAAGLVTLEILRREGIYECLEGAGAKLQQGLQQAATKANVPVQVQRVGSMLTVFFAKDPVHNWQDAARCDRDAFARWHSVLLKEGVYWPPSQFEAAFVSLAHEQEQIDKTLHAAHAAFQAC
jgi:glutamate-1-semialdehyde 2,1-aminomutase